jgi:hypothetical protein
MPRKAAGEEFRLLVQRCLPKIRYFWGVECDPGTAVAFRN